MTRHSATSQLTHVDDDVVPYFGYLPQDMLRKSIFDFYHPEDMLFLKEVYQSGMCNCYMHVPVKYGNIALINKFQ